MVIVPAASARAGTAAMVAAVMRDRSARFTVTALAIGKGGQNARLAAKLTGWKIDIQSTDIKANKDKENKKGGVVAIDKTEAEVEENTQKEEKNIGEGPERKEEETDKFLPSKDQAGLFLIRQETARQ